MNTPTFPNTLAWGQAYRPRHRQPTTCGCGARDWQTSRDGRERCAYCRDQPQVVGMTLERDDTFYASVNTWGVPTSIVPYVVRSSDFR